MKAIVVGRVNPDAISVTDRLGSLSVGAARTREYVESQAVKTTRNRFMRLTFLTSRIISGTTSERQLFSAGFWPTGKCGNEIIGKSFSAKCVDAARKNFSY
jgi:hypothetical protein